MSTLTGNKISLTYKSILKTSDNDVLTGTLKQLSDGLGNNSGVYLNTGGDLKSTGTLEFANFKATAHSVTINKLVNEADGISSNDNDTSLPTSAAVKDYVDTHVTSQDLDFSDGTNVGAVDLDSQVLAIIGTSNEIETAASGQQLQIGLPNSITISGTYTGATFSGDLNGTINTATTAVTQSAGNNSTKVATTAYVDTLDAASDLDFSGTSGTGDVNLNTQTFAITGGANQITTAASNQGLVISLLSSGVTLPNNSIATTQSAGDNSTKIATTAYVDTLDAASDLDIAGDSGTGDVNLNTQTFTLSGTTNQITTAVSGQSATFSLPSTVHRNLQGNVTGNLTGNADTATKWATARDLSLTSEATGTISSVDGSGNVSGAVTLLNSAVTGKVLTGLPTPAAGNIQASDSILEAFGKLQSQVSSISNGLIFKGSWDADTNTPTLTSGGGEVDSGTTTGQATNKLIQSGQNFNTTVSVGDKVINQVDGTTALVTVIDSNTQLSLNADIMLSGEAYTIDASPFIQQGNYYVVNYAGTTNLNGNNSWSIGDWVIADADNRWSKLDHSQVDGQGTPGNLPVFATATTIGDSIVAQSGTALTVTGSLSTTLGASVTGDFAVNTNKFTVNATSGNISVGGTGTFAGSVTITGGTTNGLNITTSGTQDTIKIDRAATSDNAITKYQTGSADKWIVGLRNTGDDNFRFYSYGTSSDVLTIDQANGNSTFAGDIKINNSTPYLLNNDDEILAGSDTGGYYFGLVGSGNSSKGIQIGDHNSYIRFDTDGGERMRIDSSGNSTFAGTASANIVIARDNMYVDGGQFYIGADNGSTDDTFRTAVASGAYKIESRESGTWTQRFIIDTNGAAAFSGDVEASGIYVGATNTSFDFYNQGTSYFNGTVTVDAAFTQSGGDASTFSGDVTLQGGRVIVKDSNNTNDAAKLTRDADEGYLQLFSSGSQTIELRGNGNSYFNGGNVGIGTTSPDGALQITAASSTTSNGNDASFKLYLTNTDTTNNNYSLINFTDTDGGSSCGGMGLQYTDHANNYGDLCFITRGSGGYGERMRISSSGNVGIGQAPSDFADWRVLELKGLTNGSMLNFENSSSVRTGAIAMNDASSLMRFQTMTASGITFEPNNAEAMRITSAGNVVVGGTAVGSNNSFSIQSNGVLDQRWLAGTAHSQVLNVIPGLSNGFQTIQDTSNNLTYRFHRGTDNLVLLDITSSGSTFGNGIKVNGDSSINRGNETSGELLLGGTTDGGFLDFDGTNLQFNTQRDPNTGTFINANKSHATIGLQGQDGGSQIIFGTAAANNTVATERMRINSSGYIYVNTGGAEPSASQVGVRITGTQGQAFWNSANAGTSGYNHFNFYNGNGAVGAIFTSGSATSFNTSSDYRLKEDLQDFNGLDKVSKIPVYDFKWKADKNRSYGVMAHELEEVLPQAVSGEKDAEEMQSVDYSKIVPLLVKSIQELKAEVDSLKKECKCK